MTDETGLTPEQIEAIKSFGDDTDALVAAAKDEASPLHALFNWDSDTDEGRQLRAENLVIAVNPPSERTEGGEDDEAAAAGDEPAAAAEGDPAPAGGDGDTAA